MEFKARQLPIPVATDVLSRGIDIEGIDLVINYDAPSEPEDYIHRIGRTATAEAKGKAPTFITPSDLYNFPRIEKLMEMIIDKPALPEHLGEAPEYTTPSKKKSGRNKKPGEKRPLNKKKFVKRKGPKKENPGGNTD